MDRPNVLVIMTDEERYPPPYESDAVASVPARPAAGPGVVPGRGRRVPPALRRAPPPACPAGPRCSPGSTPRCTACRQTDGMAKQATDPAMSWLDPDSVPTLGDWFRAGGYRDPLPGQVARLPRRPPDPRDPRGPHGLGRRRRARSRDRRRVPQSRPARPFRVLRLDRPRAPWRRQGRLRHRPRRRLRRAGGRAVRRAGRRPRRDGPWLAVASFVNPHDIAFAGFGWDQMLQLRPARRLGAGHPRGALAVGLLRRAPAVPGGCSRRCGRR